MRELFIQENLWPKDSRLPLVDDRLPGGPQGGDACPTSPAFFKKYYVPNNATMVIAGDVKFDDVKKLVEKYFGWIPQGAEPARPQYKTPRADHEGDRDQHDRRRAGAARVPRRGAARRRSPTEEPALDIAAAILGDGKSSRLYKRLVYDEKIAQDVARRLLRRDARRRRSRSSRPRSRASIRSA